MSTHEAVSCAFTRMLHALDLRDWQAVRDSLADHVDVDYSSLAGEPAATLPGDDLAGGWRAFVGAFDVTLHVTGPIVTAEMPAGEIKLATAVRGYHRLAGAAGGETWTVAGHYHARVVHRRAGWRIVGLTLRVLFQEGNLELPKIARARAAPPSPIRATA